MNDEENDPDDPQQQPAAPRSREEFRRLLHELAEIVPAGVPPLSDEAMSRESIYTREDDLMRDLIESAREPARKGSRNR